MLNAEYFQKESRRLSKKLMVWVNYTHIVNRVYIYKYLSKIPKSIIFLMTVKPHYISRFWNLPIFSEILD